MDAYYILYFFNIIYHSSILFIALLYLNSKVCNFLWKKYQSFQNVLAALVILMIMIILFPKLKTILVRGLINTFVPKFCISQVFRT